MTIWKNESALSTSEKEAYAHACFAAVRASLTSVSMAADARIEPPEVRLEDSYPDTTLFVRLRGAGGRCEDVEWEIWRDAFSGERGPHDPLEDPRAVSLGVRSLVDQATMGWPRIVRS
jgi:hypothetical protein